MRGYCDLEKSLSPVGKVALPVALSVVFFCAGLNSLAYCAEHNSLAQKNSASEFSRGLADISLLAHGTHGVSGATPFLYVLEMKHPEEYRFFFGLFHHDEEQLLSWLWNPKSSDLPALGERSMAQVIAAYVRSANLPEETIEFSGRRGVFEKNIDILLNAQKTFRRNTMVSLPKIAWIERPARGRSGTNAIMFSILPARPGSSVLTWDPKTPDVEPTRIFHSETGHVFDIHPSYDGDKILMTYSPAPGREPLHIWEIGADGSGLRQLTGGNYHDFSPVYLPNGRLCFSSSRVESYSLCQNYLACALYSCDENGNDIRRIDYTSLNTLAPAMMADGSIVCTRWEYQDKNIFSWQGLWTIRPSGRNLKLFYGNTITVPNSLYGPKPMPGLENSVAFTMSAHHHPPIGDIALATPVSGEEDLQGLRRLTFATNYRPTKGTDFADINWQPGDKFNPWAYTDPWPVSDHLLLASYGGMAEKKPHFRIVAISTEGVAVDIYGKPGEHYYFPITLDPKPRPPVDPYEPPAPENEKGIGTFFCSDVYNGLTQQGVKEGSVTHLRIMEVSPKKYNTEGPRYHDQYPVVGHGSYYVKSVLGKVPVRADGSVYFQAPSGVELYFIALDKDGREIQRMGSVCQISTGEVSSCGGCHENRRSAPVAKFSPAKSLLGGPDKIEPPSWGAGNFDYVKTVQPVFDKHCMDCHDGPLSESGFDLSGDKTRFFNASYNSLTYNGAGYQSGRSRKYVTYYFINEGPTGVFPAMQTGSYVSNLVKYLQPDHHDVGLSSEEKRAVYAWIDANVPYYPTWDMSRPHSMGGRDSWSRWSVKEQTSKMAAWILKIEKICAENNIHFLLNSITNGYDDFAYRSINLTRPENSLLLVENLAKSAGGRAEKKALFTSRNDPVYQAILNLIREGKKSLDAHPRMDMPGAVATPQVRDFGRWW